MTNVPFAFQLALFGVILVAGIFFIWRMLTGINEDIAHLRKTVTTLQVTVKGLVESSEKESKASLAPMTFSAGSGILRGMDMSLFDDDGDEDGDDGFVYQEEEAADEGEEEEEGAEAEEGTEAVDDAGKVFEYGGGSVCISEIPDADCVTDNTTNPLSKPKLTKMSVEALRDMLADHKLSTDGGKKVLIQRILNSESFSAA